MKNIIFDIGMVLVDFHWKSTMEKLGIPADVIDALDHNMINHPCLLYTSDAADE